MKTLITPEQQVNGLLADHCYYGVSTFFGPDANELVEEMRIELRHVDDQIRNHVFLANLREGRVSLQELRGFTGQQFHIMDSEVRSIAMMIHRFNKQSVQSYCVNVLQGAVESQKNLTPLAEKLGMTEKQLSLYPPKPESFAYATYVNWLSHYASPAEIVGSFLLNYETWAFNCGQMSQSLKENYGFVKEDTPFFDAYASRPSCESVECQIIQEGLNQGIDSARIHRAASLLHGYEKMFWDAMADQGTMYY